MKNNTLGVSKFPLLVEPNMQVWKHGKEGTITEREGGGRVCLRLPSLHAQSLCYPEQRKDSLGHPAYRGRGLVRLIPSGCT